MKEETREKILDELKAIGTLRTKAGLTYVLEFYSKIARIGFGISRREMTRPRKELSSFIHAFSTFRRYMGIAKEFVQFCKKKGITRLHKLSYDAVEDFLMEKIVVREASRNTVETKVCALQKFFHVCCRYDLRDKLQGDYSRFKYLAKEGGAIHAFDNPERLIGEIDPGGEVFQRRDKEGEPEPLRSGGDHHLLLSLRHEQGGIRAAGRLGPRCRR